MEKDYDSIGDALEALLSVKDFQENPLKFKPPTYSNIAVATQDITNAIVTLPKQLQSKVIFGKQMGFGYLIGVSGGPNIIIENR